MVACDVLVIKSTKSWGCSHNKCTPSGSFKLASHVYYTYIYIHMGVSENSVPLNPMVLLIIIPMKNGYFIGNINPTFSDKPISHIPTNYPINQHFCCLNPHESPDFSAKVLRLANAAAATETDATEELTSPPWHWWVYNR